MLTIRRSAERGHVDHGWLDARHTFSFASYFDAAHMGFRSLRVINEDRIAPAMGFGTHPHQDMEIFSFIISGAIAHKDSIGNERTLRPGEIQLMSAGTGVTHSEFNPSQDEPLHLLQIWIEPAAHGLPPSYTEWRPRDTDRDGRDLVVISPDGRDGSAVIHQDAIVRQLRLPAGEAANHTITDGRAMWLQMIDGNVRVDDERLHAGDGASTSTPGQLELRAEQDSVALLFDLK